MSRFFGLLSVVVGAAMLPAAGLAYRDGSADLAALLGTAAVAIAVGLFLSPRLRVDKEIRLRDGYSMVAGGWLLASFWGALPFYFGANLSLVDAYFESVSGFTTTGASILPDVETWPRGLLLWRSTTHWLGGMGIIVLVVAILPALGPGGMRLFAAEAPGPEAERLAPRIAQTAQLLWGVYFLLTAAEVLALWRFGHGQSLFDAVCHTFGTVATGGFSTRNASLGAFPALDQWIVAFFMFLAGASFTLHFRALAGRPLEYAKNAEFRFYAATMLLAALVVAAFLSAAGAPGGEAARNAFFQVVSIVTTTGYATADFEAWPMPAQAILFLALFTGGCFGSTGGGPKQARIALLAKSAYCEVIRLVHPRAVVAVRLGEKAVPADILSEAVSYVAVYFGIWLLGAFLLILLGSDVLTGASASVATLGNIGPAFGAVGPTENYAFFGPASKVVLTLLMLLGRLEIYTLLVVFTPHFWRR